MPDAHVAFTLVGIQGHPRRLVDALLRVDLGARISVDERSGFVEMEGRFWKADVVAVVERLGYRLRGLEERPPSTRTRPAIAA